MGLVDVIRCSIWGQVDHFDVLEMIPLELFNQHFGKDIMTNPHGIHIEYDLSYRSTTVDEYARVMPWDYDRDYGLSSERENQRFEWLYGHIAYKHSLYFIRFGDCLLLNVIQAFSLLLYMSVT